MWGRKRTSARVPHGQRGSRLADSVPGARSNAADILVGEDRSVGARGPWTLAHLAKLERRLDTITWPDQPALTLDAGDVTALDSAGAVLLLRTIRRLEQEGRQVSVDGLRPDLVPLFEAIKATWGGLAPAVQPAAQSWLARLGHGAWTRLYTSVGAMTFLGENATALLRSVTAPRIIRWRALVTSLETDGVRALPIVGLLTFLMGVVIAYQGAEQLRTFGANIFVVDLVGISMLREIAPLVTAILVAGRSGSAYAAQIGTMKVTEELDAIRTLGLSPVHLLVLPRVFALVIALPLLTVYADGVGVFGGMLIASTTLSVNFPEFLSRFEEAIALRHFVIGVGKAPVFAAIIALVGCYQGFQIRGGVDDVGRHTTISVVQSIFLVIVFDAFFSIVLSWWDV
jgi:phospholipid/cholesterol/gamma-HCH transport system permease protein